MTVILNQNQLKSVDLPGINYGLKNKCTEKTTLEEWVAVDLFSVESTNKKHKRYLTIGADSYSIPYTSCKLKLDPFKRVGGLIQWKTQFGASPLRAN